LLFPAGFAVSAMPCQSASGVLALRPEFTFFRHARPCAGHPRLAANEDVDGRDIWAKTRFALLPGNDESEVTDHGDP
jgi:hypothetical protein